MIDTPDNKLTAGIPAGPDTEVTVEKWVYGGSGLVRIDGQIAFVPFALPGERVRLGAVKRRASVLEAELAGITESSPDRIEAQCPVFGRCGGCQYQHAPYEYQLARKVEIVAETLKRVGKIEPPETIGTISAEPWQYRNRNQFRIDRARIGYLAAGSHKLVDIDECPISSPVINQALRSIKKKMHDPHWPRFLRSVELFTNGEQVMLNALETDGDRRLARGFFEWLDQWVPGAAAGALEYEVGGFAYRVSHGSFFQVNRHLVCHLVEAAMGGAEGPSALDLYAGVGLFTVALAKRFERVAGVESHGGAVRDMEHNAGRSGGAIRVHRAQAEQYLEQLKKAPDFVLADPPRSGLGRGVVGHLLRLSPPRLNIVSCDPPTMARDTAALIAGGYRLKKATLVDMFPQTYHIETVVELERA
ncbi:MAG TPA: class I SAM-dependent RNA methyltransferase [Bryobacteraceae bacterium]|nr:class I SAM-dependent RNA methyltransferase [Bryobacteraceae bacterium]HPT28692.1 class I SAM-dependent RNA methyltransferase [Bryobacteraceae bacterium]